MITRAFLAASLGLAGCTTPMATTHVTPAHAAAATARVGEQAPDFTLTDTQGRTVSLSELRGKTVVLEWFNPGCPFVVAAHGDEGPLKSFASTMNSEDDVVWLAINSGAEGKQGYGIETNQSHRESWNLNYPVLMDTTGNVGRLYDAKTTPHMYVIDGEGVLRYAGALDNAPLNKVDGSRVPYLESALTAVRQGQPPATPQTRPYGCSVKY